MKQKLLGFVRLLVDYVERFGFIRGIRLYFKINPPSRLNRSYSSLLTVSSPVCSSPIYLRRMGSDSAVFNQIFIKQQYVPQSSLHNTWLHQKFREAIQIGRTPVILDLGANIGLAARWFESQFPEAVIYSVEPDANNFAILKNNVMGHSNIVPLHAAVWSHEGQLRVLNRGKEAWAVQVAESDRAEPFRNNDESVQGLSISELLGQFHIDQVFIVKIDVEGAETAIFSGNTDWLARTSALIIELHDRMFPFQHASVPLFRALSPRNFDFLTCGENLFFFIES